ncbi:Gfo/Idh/MocA family protein [Usitatibacter palustris]|uniref:Glucose--fructose oxidoreductase n=1 Tax=Usitatibacter palustris TaxID=2732487 RepID=A0A6M4H7G1_9PROT|nr:Gfo/Idh/MocA family oxidoreductase [Usitatibacter palustris]QJR14633.1 Glucose--fructose oxidoreductase [Usitatibacter palustris]
MSSRRRFLELSAAGAFALASPRLHAKDPMKKLGVALVGLGMYSTGQLGPALKQTKHCRLSAVVTGSPEKGRQWARDYGFPESSVYGYDTMGRLADNKDVDIVYVVTPPALHARDCIAAAKAGKHVLCEKPMEVSTAQCDVIINACKAAGVKLSIGYRLHFDPFHEELRKLVRSQEFGPFMTMTGGFAFSMQKAQWRAEKALAGGGPLMDLGIYVVQEACMAAGATPVAATATVHPKKRPEFFKDVEESISWTLEFPNGAKCESFTSYDAGRNDFRAEAKGGWFELKPAFNYGGIAGATSRGPLVIAGVNQQALQMDDFALCVLNGQESRVGGAMGRRDMAIVEAIYASAAGGGKRVEVR